MANIIERLFLKSTGLKRSIASVLAVVIAIAPSVPALVPFIPLLTKLAAIFGAAGVAHSVVSSGA